MNGNDDQDEHDAQVHPVRIIGKCPKSYQLSQDFRTFVAKFRLYCNLNLVPEAQRATLLFTLLDGQAFEIATTMQFENMNNFEHVAEALIQKYENPSGSMGHLFKLNARKQLHSESLQEYLQALTQLAQKTTLNEEAQHNKIIEQVMNNASCDKVKLKVIKFLSTAQQQQLDHQETWTNFQELIHRIAKYSELERYSGRDVEPDPFSEKIFQLTTKINELMANKPTISNTNNGDKMIPKSGYNLKNQNLKNNNQITQHTAKKLSPAMHQNQNNFQSDHYQKFFNPQNNWTRYPNFNYNNRIVPYNNYYKGARPSNVQSFFGRGNFYSPVNNFNGSRYNRPQYSKPHYSNQNTNFRGNFNFPRGNFHYQTASNQFSKNS
jgi:uncharacterized protein YcgL (UPF0745 family)